MNLLWKLIIGTLLCLSSTLSFALENSFYILHTNPEQMPTKPVLPSLAHHFGTIHILISQAYHVNEYGAVTGFVDPNTYSFANNHNIKFMIMVTNASFDQDKVHQLLSNPDAQKNAIHSILNLCKENNYYGVQFDFENVSVADRTALTEFYVNAAKALHEKGYVVSFAIIPVADSLQETAFLKRKYDNWAGVYDLKALSENGDFISIMAYDQHTHGTIPGPTASIRWVDAAVKHALKFIPAHKLSLGIPVYSGYWYTGSIGNSSRITTNLMEMSYPEIKSLITKNHIKLKWDNIDKVNYAVYEHAWLNEYIFAEDAQSFRAKLAVAKKYDLRGISVFSLGNEDPGIWEVLNPASPNNNQPRKMHDGKTSHHQKNSGRT